MTKKTFPTEGAEPVKRPRGRPSFQPTDEMREKVCIWKAGGMTDEDIARVLEIDADTMKKHFADELATHWAKKSAQVIEARFEAAMAGNVTAQTRFLESARTVSAISRISGEMTSTAAVNARKKRVMPIGKKEAADEAAKTAGLGTEWGDDLRVDGTLQ